MDEHDTSRRVSGRQKREERRGAGVDGRTITRGTREQTGVSSVLLSDVMFEGAESGTGRDQSSADAGEAAGPGSEERGGSIDRKGVQLARRGGRRWRRDNTGVCKRRGARRREDEEGVEGGRTRRGCVIVRETRTVVSQGWRAGNGQIAFRRPEGDRRGWPMRGQIKK